ncbi:hypothetical protein WN944_013139 [Citrus x changshan-huyou]|uniref:Cupin type-1 domain-containing protein n=1 Tax=Citrus x changshan-huyou TaxID=2935761 RepID=A0AAP0M3A3_9ROSI
MAKWGLDTGFFKPRPKPIRGKTSVADLNAPISINGFSCKLDLEVTSDDFFTDFSKDPTTFDIFKRAVTFGDVSGFPAVNTQGVSRFRIDLDVGRINQPHTHPCGTEAGIITRVKVLLGLVANNNTFFSKVLTLGKASTNRFPEISASQHALISPCNSNPDIGMKGVCHYA